MQKLQHKLSVAPIAKQVEEKKEGERTTRTVFAYTASAAHSPPPSPSLLYSQRRRSRRSD